MPPLFSSYPALQKRLPWVSLGTLPTPVERLTGLCGKCGRNDLYIKRDDVSADPYGGNKVRKLEFLLADAENQGAVRVITSGAAGSNHSLATALYARNRGLAATLVLFDQPPSPSVRDNLLMDAAAGAEMVYRERYHEYDATIAELMQRYSKREGRAPYLIVPGGSSPTGALGFVNAMFELKQQIERNEAPEPAAIYVPLGTMGTAAGMYLGVRAARLRSRLVGVRVTPLNLADWEQFAVLCRQTCDLLHSLDPSFPARATRPKAFQSATTFSSPATALPAHPLTRPFR